ncbi:DeoR/GlpR family DNA-binding transcription regulator [Trueperella pecoris]|uniref:DeoR/GlpR transcriptional regulator n=1 Tax=Trueperella pecoris TaxID=2733571 RepID=A0A7M1QVU4_9ACTO|nr:DeoR/GlpR family DNA-binding transcription regulator [Trueperella pecoris]QOQ39442.1 DeoR/GlpR transcriptional regulator [Trueperella pecoris]QOR45941.1 DeoR/GlpR transcriptional regulator [Trueperella pecoris]QTG75770.1 DeoR/GlpR transcriptional regulator [Trueperella pecoris]
MTAKLSPAERQTNIIGLIIERGSLHVEELAEQCGVSLMTLYRDLAVLESRQITTRRRGHVSLLVSSISEAPFSFRLGQEWERKVAVARVAAQLVSQAATVFFDDSTTGYAAIDHIDEPAAKAFITNSMPAARRIAEGEYQSLTLIGGHLVRQLDATFGAGAISQVRELAFETALIGAASIKAGAIYHPFGEVAAFKRELISHVDVPILVATMSKIDRIALHRMGDISDFAHLVIDDSISDQVFNEFSSQTNVIVVSPEKGQNHVRAD